MKQAGPVAYRSCLAGALRSLVLLAASLIGALVVVGCSSYQAVPLDELSFRQGMQTQQREGLRVSVAVLSDEDAAQAFGIDLGSRWIQAVWVEVENGSRDNYWLLPGAIDPDIYSPDEVSYSARFLMSPGANDRMVQHFRDLGFQNPIAAGSVRSGFVLVPQDLDGKEIHAALVGPQGPVAFDFFVPLSALKSRRIQEIHEQRADKHPVELSATELRQKLRELDCCMTDESGTRVGDPLNLVLVGNPDELMPAFMRRGWHPAEETYAGSVWKTMGSFLFGRRYRYSPISPMYLFGREQDIGQQKARGTIHQRNHLRLWLSPWRWQGKDVWVGAISRDIGVRFTTKTPYLVTHKIDADVDEARNTFIESMLLGGRLAQAGFVSGAGRATPEQPGHNLTGDPYFHDGLRAVLVFSNEDVSLADLEFLHWAESDLNARHLHAPVQRGANGAESPTAQSPANSN